MTTDEIIRRLRFRADGEMSAAETAELLNEAADRLEELDERVAIMSEGKTGKWLDDGIIYCRGEKTNRWRCSNCLIWLLGQEKPKTKYCPGCGVRMEEENDNTNAWAEKFHCGL